MPPPTLFRVAAQLRVLPQARVLRHSLAVRALRDDQARGCGRGPTNHQAQPPNSRTNETTTSKVLNLAPPNPSNSLVSITRQDSHAGSLAYVDGHLPHSAHLSNACAAIEGATEVALQLWVDLLLFQAA